CASAPIGNWGLYGFNSW
nr:immunoglobulin heavy chain junction region [Macaca mulatta]MOW98229.1 immunoglobulin heavy chain junction region [Macaca mulatta]MOW98244.1 immunoglobulin heavy chain junction region [Macaca mulatta]MOW98665.1 immunoglobulin heavy chain junction region [Macaca mulatta]MOW98962.1 immunoglobulin heavy chain junction region [Macaca mulatta]